MSIIDFNYKAAIARFALIDQPELDEKPGRFLVVYKTPENKHIPITFEHHHDVADDIHAAIRGDSWLKVVEVRDLECDATFEPVVDVVILNPGSSLWRHL